MEPEISEYSPAAMEEREPTVAVLGQGSIGRRHAALLRAIGCHVLAFDPSPDAVYAEAVERAASEEEALASSGAAVVASPTSEHLAQAARALDHGCHLLVEKPLATRSGPDVEALVERARAESRLVAVAMNLRFHPGPVTVHALVSSGAIGTPLVARFSFGSYLPDWRPEVDYRRSYSARQALGGGVLLDVIHELDYATWILGRPVEAGAWLGRISTLEIDVEDVVLAHVRFDSGVVAALELDYLDRSYRRGCRIVGSDATVDWDWAAGRVTLLGPDGMVEHREAPPDFASTYCRQAEAWVSAIAAPDPGSRTDRLVGAAEAAATLRLADAIRQAGETGCRVPV